MVHVFGFKGLTATKYTVKEVILLKFWIMHFVRVIKPFLGEEFLSEVLYAFKKECRLVAPPRKFNITNKYLNNWKSPISNEMNWLVFLMKVDSMSLPLTWEGNKKDLIKMRHIVRCRIQTQLKNCNYVRNDPGDQLIVSFGSVGND